MNTNKNAPEATGAAMQKRSADNPTLSARIEQAKRLVALVGGVCAAPLIVGLVIVLGVLL